MNYSKHKRRLNAYLCMAKLDDVFHDEYIKKAINILLYSYNNFSKLNDNSYTKLLELERICLSSYDRNDNYTNSKLIDRKLVSCDTAIQEAKIFENDSTLYKQNFIESRVKNINAPTAISRGTKDILIYLGREQQSMGYDKTQPLDDFIEARKDILRLVAREFKKSEKVC